MALQHALEREALLFRSCAMEPAVVQCVAVKSAISEEVWDELKALGQESAVVIKRHRARG
jgi:hypothetical protein